MDLWIFSESYGGKMTANFGVALHDAIQNKEITINFKGVALGDSWIDPVGCMYSYAEFLESISEIDDEQANNLTYYAQKADEAWQQGQGVNATNWWGVQQGVMEAYTGNVNVYNFMYFTDYIPEGGLSQLMNGPIRKQLGIIPDNVTWGGQADQVFSYMAGDFMNTGVKAVETLLSEGYQVVVYSGQLDIIVDVVCIENWISNLQWPFVWNFWHAPRQTFTINGIPNGYMKSYKNLSLWNVLHAGHMVPYDNGPMALQMFASIIGANK